MQMQQADGAAIYSHRRLSTRSLITAFGTVKLIRMGYSKPSGPSIFPLDQALALPARSFSYELSSAVWSRPPYRIRFWNRFKPLPS